MYFLTLVSASIRLLVLTNPEFYGMFTRVTAGQTAEGLRVKLLPLLPEMQNSVDGVTRLVSEEMSRDAVSVASAVAAEEAGERGEDVLPERHTD